MQNILFFGDSLTADYGLSNTSTESYPALLEQKIKAAGLPYQVINAGLSGDTTAGGLNRIDYWLNKPVAVFVLELGINDIRRGIPPASIAKNLQAIIDKVKAKYPQAKLALLGMEIPAFLGAEISRQFSAAYHKVAADNQMAFLPYLLSGVAGKKALNLADRVHPNPEGYKIIADQVWPVLKGALHEY